jgi:hypothetical protein
MDEARVEINVYLKNKIVTCAASIRIRWIYENKKKGVSKKWIQIQ